MQCVSLSLTMKIMIFPCISKTSSLPFCVYNSIVRLVMQYNTIQYLKDLEGQKCCPHYFKTEASLPVLHQAYQRNPMRTSKRKKVMKQKRLMKPMTEQLPMFYWQPIWKMKWKMLVRMHLKRCLMMTIKATMMLTMKQTEIWFLNPKEKWN